MLVHGVAERNNKEVLTLQEFAPRFLQDQAQANRQKPSGIASKETIIRMHLIPVLGTTQLDQISTADVQRLKRGLVGKAPKTVNNVLIVLNVLLKKAVEWDLIEKVPCTIRLVGLRCGEIAGLEWRAVDLAKRQLWVRQSDWRGQLVAPKNGRIRYVPLTQCLATALKEYRHLRSSRVLCKTTANP